MKPFFMEIPNFWAWADKWADKFCGIFGQTISIHFGAVSPFSMFFIIQPLFLQKAKPLLSISQTFIWNWNLNLDRKELGI